MGRTLVWPITAVLKSVRHKTVLHPIKRSWVIQKPFATSWKTLQSWSGIEIKFLSSCVLGNHQKSMKTVCLLCSSSMFVCAHVLEATLPYHQSKESHAPTSSRLIPSLLNPAWILSSQFIFPSIHISALLFTRFPISLFPAERQTSG